MTTTINNHHEAGGGETPLPTRVFMVEHGLEELKSDMTQGFSDVRTTQAGNHAELKTLVEKLASTQAERAKIQWPAISVIVGIIGVAGTLVYTPIKERQGEILEQLHDRVTRNEFVTTLTSIGSRRDDAQRTMEGRVGRVEQDVDKLQGAVVPRGEIDAHWADQRDRDATFRAELDGLIRPPMPYAAPTRH